MKIKALPEHSFSNQDKHAMKYCDALIYTKQQGQAALKWAIAGGAPVPSKKRTAKSKLERRKELLRKAGVAE